MKITRLRLENFRKHQNSTLQIGEVGLVEVRGKNFAGKSSIGQALSMCLTPSTSGLDAQGRDFYSKIKRGADKAVVEVDIQGKRHLVRRVLTLNMNSSGRTRHSICLDDPDWSPKNFDQQLDQNRAALTVCLNTDAFLRMDEKEQKNLLATLALPRTYSFDPKVVAAVERVLGSGQVAFANEPFRVIEQAYKKLFDERQIVNRQVREFAIPDPLPTAAGIDSATLQEQLTTLRMTRRERDQQRTQAVEKATAQHAERERHKAKAQVYQESIADEERRAVAIRAFLLSDDKLAEFRKLVEGRENLERLKKDKQEIESTLVGHLRRAARLDELEDLANAACPTCEQPINKARLEAMSADVAKLIHEAKTFNQSVYDQIVALKPVEEAIAEIEKYEGARKELADIEARIGDNKRRLAQTEEKMPQAVLFDFGPFNRSLEELDAEIERLANELRPVIAAEERGKEIATRQQQLAVLKEKAALLDRLVKYFDKDGIKAKLLGEYIGGFENKINAVLSAWGYAATFRIEPYTFDVANADGDVIPLKELSGAERVMFSLAFQCAVARTAGLGLVVIDEVAMFLPELRPVLNTRLEDMLEQGYLDQVILLVADGSETAGNRSVVFVVESGTVRKLEAMVAA